jgi:hypothetical protein
MLDDLRQIRAAPGRKPTLTVGFYRPTRRFAPLRGSFGNSRLLASQRQKAPSGGLVGERVAKWRYDALLIANLPRSVFLNRASFPLVLISRKIAE